MRLFWVCEWGVKVSNGTKQYEKLDFVKAVLLKI